MPAPKREPFDERIMPTFDRFQARSDERFRIPLLPIVSIPATMEMSGLPAERSMNVDSDAVMAGRSRTFRRRRSPEPEACWRPSSRSWSRNSGRYRDRGDGLISIDGVLI
jgi:hypothetical protein